MCGEDIGGTTATMLLARYVTWGGAMVSDLWEVSIRQEQPTGGE